MPTLFALFTLPAAWKVVFSTPSRKPALVVFLLLTLDLQKTFAGDRKETYRV
jgi:hypothetical protein